VKFCKSLICNELYQKVAIAGPGPAVWQWFVATTQADTALPATVFVAKSRGRGEFGVGGTTREAALVLCSPGVMRPGTDMALTLASARQSATRPPAVNANYVRFCRPECGQAWGCGIKRCLSNK
jgi:hypothetical protein